MLQFIITIIILGFAILIHELGHLLAALLTGVKVERFSLGFGPMVIRKKIKDIDFGIGPIPFGGYVKIKGKDGIFSHPPRSRFPILFSGPLFNILTAPIVIIGIFIIFGLKVTPTRKVIVGDGPALRAGIETGDEIISINGQKVDYWDEISELLLREDVKRITFRHQGVIKTTVLTGDSLGIEPLIAPVIGTVQKEGPADQAGIKDGDIIRSIDGKKIERWDEMAKIIQGRPGEKIGITVQRGDEIMELVVVPKRISLPDTSFGQIGVMARFKTVHPSILEAVGLGIDRFGQLLSFTSSFLLRLVIGRESIRNLGGPIAIAKVSGESYSWGTDTLLFFLAFILVNLGIINLLPIPILDGGSIILSVYESIRRRRVSKNFLLIWQQVGLSIFVLLAILVTFNDLTR
ncbi:MAG TPA: RIP metalloprotease RseP [bacterium (Candidatus Stahlbacteria)]|nr:RIP metalloprotease RseP [Candidatus Stahlbacteria bacterium]